MDSNNGEIIDESVQIVDRTDVQNVEELQIDIKEIKNDEANTINTNQEIREKLETIPNKHKPQSPDSSDYDDEITPEEDLVNTIKSNDIEEEKLAKIKRLFNNDPKPKINFQGKDNDTPLHIAIRKGGLEVIKFLVQKGAKVNDDSVRNKRNRTPLDSAKHLKRQDIVQILEPQINDQAHVEKQPANGQQFQENPRSGSNSGEAYNTQSSNQPKIFTSNRNSEDYPCGNRKGTTGGLDGHFYEIDLLILGKLRGDRKDINKFYLTANQPGLGAFDDIVIRYWKNNGEEEKSTIILLQAKHAENPNKDKVTIEKFTNRKEKNFYLGKYFCDYLKNKKKFNDQSKNPLFKGNFQELDLKYIIYTNRILDERFDKKRKIDIDNCIFSTKSKEDKAFKFSLDDKNHDLISELENVPCQERIKLLAEALVSCISGKLNYKNMMRNELFLSYHVFLAKNFIKVGEEIKEDKNKYKYREGKINHDFLNIDNKDLLKNVLKEEILYEYAKNLIFKQKSCSELDDVNKRVALVDKVVKSLESSQTVDEDVIEKLGGNIIVLDTETKLLKFAYQEKIEEESAKQFMSDLKSKVSALSQYKFDIPYELVKKALKEQTEKKTLKFHVCFGNISPTIKKSIRLTDKLVELFKKYKSEKIIKIDDNVDDYKKSLNCEDIKNIGKLVGNLLIFDKNEKMLKLASKESCNGDILEFITNLKSAAQLNDLDIFSYRFDIKVKNFPRETLHTDDEDRTNVKEFLSKLEIFTGQPNHQEFEGIIKDEIKEIYDLTVEEAVDSFLKIKDKAEKYWKEGVNYLRKDDDFFSNIVKFNIEFDLQKYVDLFTGREKQLDELHEKIQRSSEVTVSSRMTSISGLGGIGKTELAKKYAYDYGKYYDGNVIWINAENHQTLTKSFLILAGDKLGLSVKCEGHNHIIKDIKSIVEDVYRFFSRRKSLFIFDNAEKLRTQDDGDEGIDKFLPSLLSNVNKPYILITSRNRKWGGIEVLPLGTFTEKEATDFISGALKIKDDSQKNEIQKLVEKLESFPLALAQAVAYIIQADEEIKNVDPKKEFKIDKYLEKYENKTRELLNFTFPDDSSVTYKKTMFTTLQVTIDKIKKKEHGEKALEILDIIAYCAPDNIPTEIFLKLAEDDDTKLGAIVQLLKQYSMVNIEKALSVHRLVQEVTRIILMEEERQEETLRKALELIKNYDSKELLKVTSYEKQCLQLTRTSECRFCLFKENGKLSNCENHVAYIWSYASKYGQLIEDFYSTYGKKKTTPIHLFAITGKKKAIHSILKNVKLKDKVKEYNIYGFSPVHLAALNGHKEIVKYLIEKQGINVDFMTRLLEITPMSIAVVGNQLHVVQYLIEKGADPNGGGINGKFPILCAALFGNKDIIEYLINENADILLKDKLNGDNVLHSALMHSIHCRNLPFDIKEIVECLLNKNSFLVNDANWLGKTPLHLAAQSGSPSMVKMLLGYGADILLTDNRGENVLHFALMNLIESRIIIESSIELINPSNIEDIIKYCLDKNSSLVNYANLIGEKPLHFALRSGSARIVKILLDYGADILLKDKHGNNVLHFALMHCTNLPSDIEEISEYCLDTNRVLVNDANLCGMTPLHLAAQSGSTSIVKMLLGYGADILLTDNRGENVLHFALMNLIESRIIIESSIELINPSNIEDIIKYCLDKNSSLVNYANWLGKTPLHYAAQSGRVRIFEMLLNYRADILLKDKNGNNVLHFALMHCTKHPSDIEEIFKYCLDTNRVLVNDANLCGMTPLHLAAQSGSPSIVKMLLGYGADILLTDNRGENVLHYAFMNLIQYRNDSSDIKEIVEYLLEKNSSLVNYANSQGATPLHFAVRSGSASLVKMLLDYGANILLTDNRGENVLHVALMNPIESRNNPSNIEDIIKYCLEKHSSLVKNADEMGWTPLHFAAQCGCASIVKMLLDYGADVNAKCIFFKSVIGGLSQVKLSMLDWEKDNFVTPLFLAAMKNGLESVKLLLQKGAIYNFAINVIRSTPLEMAEPGSDVENLLISIDLSFEAIRNGEKDELDKSLEGKDSDVLKSILNARDHNEKTLLEVAIANNQKDIAGTLIKKIESC